MLRNATDGYTRVMPETAPSAQNWPGKRLGLPEKGPRSVGRFGRRALGIIIDWAIASALVWAFFPDDIFGFWRLGIFAVLQVAFVLVLNGSIGHLIVGLRVVPINGGYLGYWRPFARAILLSLAIPAVIWDKDQRGMHDRLVGTVLVRR